MQVNEEKLSKCKEALEYVISDLDDVQGYHQGDEVVKGAIEIKVKETLKEVFNE